MRIEHLGETGAQGALEADLVIVGGGACGLAIARELAGAPISVIVLESGLMEETAEHAELNRVLADDVPQAARAEFHSALPSRWEAGVQPFGVRCRGLGGSTQAWAGKSAPFDAMDYAERAWVPGSGWPVGPEDLAPFLERAAELLNLGPLENTSGFWALQGSAPPQPEIDPELLQSYFWQFARSRANPMDTLRMGEDFAALEAPNLRVLLDATVTQIATGPAESRFSSVTARSLDGGAVTVRARACVLAASAIENARLLLASPGGSGAGLGNGHGQVGRGLCDHVHAPLGAFGAAEARVVARRFGFFGLRWAGRSHMYAHGLALPPALQERGELLNAALFFTEERAPDDPSSALKRLLTGQSPRVWQDAAAVARSPGHMARIAGLVALEHRRMPPRLRDAVVDQVIRRLPNAAAREYRFRGVPHKLSGVLAHAICEQAPDPENRVSLAQQRDRFGQPLPEVRWSPGPLERRTLLAAGRLLHAALPKAGLPVPPVPDWLAAGEAAAVPVMDFGHTAGTTRMSASASGGVVNADLRLHEAEGLYVAGGSVFPTPGHANPTLMMVALSVRLAQHLKKVLARPPQVLPAETSGAL